MTCLLADLHVHTALSPCGGDEMTPPAIVAVARERGLDVIAVCDHNSTRNVAAVQRAAEGVLAVVPGMELTTAEEVHVVGLFPSAARAEAAGEEVRALLPEAEEGYASFFGEQRMLAADGSLAGVETRALALATPLDLGAALELLKRHGGLAVAAHVDRRSFGVIAQLGFFPADADFDAIDVSRYVMDDAPLLRELSGFGLSITGSSDSHYLADVGAAATELTVAAPTFAELALALRGQQGRQARRTPRGGAAGAGPAGKREATGQGRAADPRAPGGERHA